jgi:hypothetical protein
LVVTSVADPGCLSRIPDPGSDFFPSWIPDPGFELSPSRIPDPGSSSKNLSILTPKKAKKWFLSSKNYDPGCSSRISDPDADFLPSRIPDPEVKKVPYPIPDPGSGSATLVVTIESLSGGSGYILVRMEIRARLKNFHYRETEIFFSLFITV